MFKSIAVALISLTSFFAVPVLAQSHSQRDVFYLNYLNRWLDEQNNSYLGDSSVLKIEDALAVCVNLQAGVALEDFVSYLYTAINQLELGDAVEAQNYWAGVIVVGVQAYCPQYDYQVVNYIQGSQ